MKKILALLLTLLIPAGIAAAAPPETSAIAEVKERTVTLLRGGDSSGARRMEITRRSDQWCGDYLAGEFFPVLQIEGDPIETTRRAGARSAEIQRLAFAFSDRKSAWFENSRILERVSAATEDVLAMYQSGAAREGNWYTWLITVPKNLLAAGLLMEEALPPGLLENLEQTMAVRLERMVLTGANASWEARNHIYLALLTDDRRRLAKAAERVFVDVRYGSVSGVREDYAYLFHGQIPYAGVYGAGFAQTVSQFVYLFSGSPWAPQDAKADLVANFLLEHTHWLTVGDYLSWTVCGRRYDVPRSSRQILDAMLFLSQSGVSRARELRGAAKALIEAGAVVNESVASWADDLMVSTVAAVPPSGFRFWPSAEMGVYRGNGFQVGFRQYSKRVQDYEYLILQGAEGWNLAMGAMDLIRLDQSGVWYDEGRISDAIEMEFLPGVTSREGANPVNPTDKFSGNIGFSLNYGTSEFSGGCGGRKGGVAGFVLIPPYGQFEARKSLHFFPRGYWAIGSGISVTKTSSPAAGHVRTNIIQWPTGQERPKLMASGDRTIVVPESESMIESAKWLWIDELGVVFPEPTNVHCSRRAGVVTIWIDHGLNPMDAGYAYAVLPVLSLQDVIAFSDAPPVSSIRGDLSVHAVIGRNASTGSMVFFEAGSHEGIRVDHPAIVHVESEDHGSILTLQNPLHSDESIHLESDLNGEITFASAGVSIKDHSSKALVVSTKLGRIYRVGTDAVGESLEPIRREDLVDLHRFKVSAASDSQETRLTLRLPRNWRTDNYRISLHGRLGHHLVDLGADDVVEELEDDLLVYRWDRSLPRNAESENDVLLQRTGDFRIWYETEMHLAIDYFSVPLFDQNGSEILDPDYKADANSPYRRVDRH